MKSNDKSTTPIIAAHAKKNNGNKPAPPSEGKSNGAKRVSRASKKAADKMKCQIMERIHDGIVAFDSEMNYTYVNEQAAKILGREPQDLVGKKFLEIYPDLMGSPFLDVCQRALETQTVIPFDGYFAPSNTWFEARIYPSSDGISILLSEGKHLEESSTLAPYNIHDVSQFPEQNPNPVMRFTRDGKLLYANPASASLLTSWKGQTTHNLPIELQELFFAVSETGLNREIELENEGITYSCLLVPVKESEYVNLYFSDITERKQTQESINALIHQTITGITRTDTQGKFLFVNESFCQLTGYSESELLGKKTWEVNHPDDVAKNKRVFERMIAEGEPYQLEKRILRRNGSILWVTVGASPLRDPTGQIYAAVFVIIDITRRKRAEESLLDNARRSLYLASLSDAIRPLNRTSEIEAEAVRILGIHLKASRVMYATLKPDDTAIVKSNYIDGLAEPGSTFNLGKYVPSELLTKLRAGRTVAISEADHIHRSSDPLEALDEPASVHTEVVVPLLKEGELVAALFVRQSQKREWKHEDIHAIEETAERMQTAIERARAEEALIRERELLEAIVETMPVMLSMYDPSATSQRLNPQFRKLTGWEEETASPRELVELCYPDPEYRKDVMQRLSACQPNEWVDVKMQTRDGRMLETTWSNIQFSNGIQVGLGIDITQRKQAEEALRESEEKYRRIVETANEGIWEIDKDTRTVFVNHRMAEMLGYTPEEMMGRSSFQFVVPDDHSEGEHRLERAKKGVPSRAAELRYRRKDGSMIWAIASSTPRFDEQGNFISSMAMISDITERKHAEHEIHRLNMELKSQLDETQALLDLLPTGVWIGNHDCSVITGNPAAYRIMGLPSGINASVTTSESQMPSGLRLFVNGEEVAPEDAPMQVVARSGKPLQNIEHELLFENGTRKSVYASIVPLFDARGKVRKVIGAYTDFTERKQTEQSLARERILLERLFETMPVMVSMYDPETKSMRLNAEFEKTIGWKSEEVSPTFLLEALYPDPEYRMDILKRMAAAGNTQEWVEVRLQTRDGRMLDSLWSNISILDEEQQLVTGIAIGIDITERTQQERQLIEKAHLLDLTNDAIVVRDPQDRITYWNRGAEQLYGWRSEEVPGRVTHELLQTEHPKPLQEIMDSLLRDGSWSGELIHTRRDGTRIVTFSRWALDRDAHGQRAFILETNIDITERKEGERALVEYARQQSALYKLVDQLHRADTLEDVFNASLDAIISALQCDRASILLFDETKIMHFIAWRGLSEEYRKATDGHSPWKYGEKDPMPIWYDDVNSSDLSDSLKTVVVREGIRSLAFIPLVYQETLIGKFMVYYNTPHIFTEAEINLSLTIGRQLAASVDRKRAEERLRSSEDRLRLAVAAGKIGIWDIDLVRRDRAWSKEGKAIYGLAEDDFLDFERQIELTHPDDRAYVDEMVRAFRDQGTIKQLNLEHRLVHPDGSVRWVEVQGEAVYADKPLPVRLIGTIVDITERKLIEDALRQSEERFAQFMQYLPGLAWIKDINGRYVFANAAAEKAFGTSRDELYGKTDMEFFPPDVAAQFKKNDDLALTEVKGIQVVETLKQDDGMVHHSLVTKFPIPGVAGKPALIGGTAFDITEQRQMENALQESEERYRALVNQATAGIVRKDPNGKLIFVNDAFGKMLGYTVSELQGKTMWQITHPEDVSENRRLYNRLMTEGTPFQLEKRLIRRDGSIIWATVSVSPVLDAAGKPDSAVSVYADITERKLAESHLALLIEVGDLTRRLNDPVELMASVADVVGRHFQVKRCLFNEIDIANDREIVHRDYHDGVESVAGTHTLTEYSSVTTREMIAGKTVVNSDSKTDPRTAPDYERSYVPNGERAYVAVPLTREDHWVASLWISDDKPHPWSEDEVALLQTIAERTWTATEKLRINNALRDSEERLRKLNTELEERVQQRTAELQAANEFLRESEATSRLILESMPDAILIADKEGRIVYGNTQVEHLFGYSPQEVIGQSVEVLIPQRFHDKHTDHRGDYGENPHRRYMGLDRELFGQRKNQSEFPVDVMLSPISNNTNWEVMVTIRDNTEQKQAQQALRANEEKLRKLFQVLPVGISFLDHQDKITEMNSALTDILGLSKHELLEGKFRQRRYIRSDGSPMLPSEFASVRAREEQKPIYNVESGIIKEDGSMIWTSVNAAPVDIADVDVVVATIDITERKKAEEALHKHRERLRILSRRLVEVQEEERRSLARELHDRVGQNLAALNLNLNILRGQLTNTALLEVGQRLSDSVNLVNQILTITRNVMGDLRSDVLDDYGLEAALREYAEKFTLRTGVQVIFDKSAKPIARTDASIEMTLLRIAQEALTNVAKHAQAKQATVSVSGDNEAVYMSIQDDGIGILSWQRANQAGSHGLRIIRERAEAFGGSVQVQSTYKKGTRIDVKIPLVTLSQSKFSREKHS